MSATACVSAADPDRQHHIVSWTLVSLSVTLFAMYAPVVVLLSAPRITPSLKLIAMLEDSKVSSETGFGSHLGMLTLMCQDCKPISKVLTSFKTPRHCVLDFSFLQMVHVHVYAICYCIRSSVRGVQLRRIYLLQALPCSAPYLRFKVCVAPASIK